MPIGTGGTHQNPHKLLLLETVLHLSTAGVLYIQVLAGSLQDNLLYGILGAFAAAIALRSIACLLSTSESTITGNFGLSVGFFQLFSTLLLGLCWGLLIPLFQHLQLDFSTLNRYLPLLILVAALALFTGSALNTRLLLIFLAGALLPTAYVLFNQQQNDNWMTWGIVTFALLSLSRASSGLDQLIERFLQISRGNTDLVKNLAKTRDEALAAQKAAEQARAATQEEVVERKKAEERIKASEQELNRILNDMTDIYFQVDLDGKLTRISPSIEYMLGYAPDDACNRPWQNLFSDTGDYSQFLKALETNFGNLMNHDVRLRHSTGNDIWVSLNAHYRETQQGERLGFEGLARDTTQTRAAQESLFQEKELWRVTLQSIADGVITTDIKGQVNYLNPVAEKMTGWTNTEAQQQLLPDVMELLDEGGEEHIAVPVSAWLEEGREAALVNPALLVQKNTQAEAAIELSGSPIRDSHEQVIGSVMVFHDVTRLRSLAMQLSYQATHDALTGLINRVEFDARVEQAIHSSNQTEKQHALMYIDLDQFKVVNDTCGHPAGDDLLRQVTRLLRSCLRESDVLARLGGDEFGVLLIGCPLDKAEEIAEKLRSNVESFRFRHDNMEFRIGASIGLVPIVDSQTQPTELMKAVDSACYVAKEQGRNRVHVSKPDDKEIAQHHGQMQWMQRIQRAVEEDELVLYSQPIVSIEDPSDDHLHVEVLLRMIENKGTENERIIPPAAFLPAAERYHLMPLIDRWVLNKTLHKIAEDDKDVKQLLSCAINLSGQSLTDLKLYDYILKLLEETNVDPKRICFEITESAVIANMQIAREFVDGLRKLGCRFALDDFGSGLSTFDYLKQLNVDYVKLDGSLVRDIATSRVSQAMVHAINYVVHVMGMKSIAEFVESDAILQALIKLSVDYAQGYAIAKPHRFCD